MGDRSILLEPEEVVEILKSSLGVDDSNSAVASENKEESEANENNEEIKEEKEGDDSVENKDVENKDTDDTALADLQKEYDDLKNSNDQLQKELSDLRTAARQDKRGKSLEEAGITFASDDDGKKLTDFVLGLEDSEFDSLMAIIGMRAEASEKKEEETKEENKEADSQEAEAEEKSDEDKTEEKEEDTAKASMVAGDTAGSSTNDNMDSVANYLRKMREPRLFKKID
jgi:hypothetical protein